MYYPNVIEDVCYEDDHITQVLKAIEETFPIFFERFIESGGGQSVSDEAIVELSKKFGISALPKAKPKNCKAILDNIINESINDFESDRKDYKNILDPEALAEYKTDVGSFKDTVLRNQCPIIRKTLQNKSAKELDKYRLEFNKAFPGDLFKVVKNIVKLSGKWKKEWYNSKKFENLKNIEELGYTELDDEKFTVRGVIGGGIRSYFIYKLYPFMFPYRRREALWALWYLTNKEVFGCKQDSEFLMINIQECTTQQNYFYPYGLFAYYAYKIYHLLRDACEKLSVQIPKEYRFVIVDRFLSFVADVHKEDIDTLKLKSKDYHYDY